MTTINLKAKDRSLISIISSHVSLLCQALAEDVQYIVFPNALTITVLYASTDYITALNMLKPLLEDMTTVRMDNNGYYTTFSNAISTYMKKKELKDLEEDIESYKNALRDVGYDEDDNFGRQRGILGEEDWVCN